MPLIILKDQSKLWTRMFYKRAEVVESFSMTLISRLSIILLILAVQLNDPLFLARTNSEPTTNAGIVQMFDNEDLGYL
jgi:hypothetical protein